MPVLWRGESGEVPPVRLLRHSPRPGRGRCPGGASTGDPGRVETRLPAREIRKTVTLLFTDLKDSTALTGSIDAEAMNEIKARYFSAMGAQIRRHGGEVEKNIGDAIMAVFGRIRAHEDDALRAVARRTACRWCSPS